MRSQTALIFAVLCIISVSGFLEVSLQRKSDELKIKIGEIAQKNKQVQKCQNDVTRYKYNSTVITQMCFHKDLAFTVETLIGDVNFNYEVAAIAVDLHSPVSWLKSTKCFSCAKNTTIPTFKEAQNFQCPGSSHTCKFNEFQSDYIVTNKYRQNKPSSIISNNMFLYGEYILSKFSFLGYDPKKKKSMFRYVEEQLQKDSFEKYEDLITFPSLKMIAAEKMIGYDDYPGDGAIGLGLNQIFKKGENKMETNTDIMEALSSAVEQIDDRIFGIYINEIGEIFKDYVLILGGINDKYSHSNLDDIQYVNVNSDTSYYWSLPLTDISFHVPSVEVNKQGVKNQEEFNVIKVKKQNAILSLSTSFIALPKDELNQLIAIINRYGNSDCKIVDLTYFAVYCRDIRTETLQLMEINFTFVGGAKLTLDYKQLQRQCNVDDNYEREDRNDNDCLLNIQLSPTDNIILGEPFLKKHYTIFDQENSKVGFLPAADNTYWRKEFYSPPSFVKYLIRIVIAIFILGMLFIICISQVMRFCKWFKRRWRGDSQGGHYSEKVAFAKHKDELSYDDIELTMREQAMNELKNQQHNDDNSFVQTQFQDDSMRIDIEEHNDFHQSHPNNYPTIPQPPVVHQTDLLGVEQPPQPFDHGFNFVSDNGQNKGEPTTETHNNNKNGFEQTDDISISLDDENHQNKQ